MGGKGQRGVGRGPTPAVMAHGAATVVLERLTFVDAGSLCS